MLRRGEQRVRALALIPAGLRRRRHQALPRGRAGRVRQRADDGQQHGVPDLQRVEREEDRQRRERESAEEIGSRARANRADRVHDPPAARPPTAAPDAGEDRNPGERGAARRGQHQPRDRDRHDDVPAQRYGVCQHQEGQRGNQPGRVSGEPHGRAVGHATNERAGTGKNPSGSWPAPHRSFGRLSRHPDWRSKVPCASGGTRRDAPHSDRSCLALTCATVGQGRIRPQRTARRSSESRNRRAERVGRGQRLWLTRHGHNLAAATRGCRAVPPAQLRAPTVYPKSPFSRFANWTARAIGHPAAFAMAGAVVVLWLVSGPIFGFSDTWQLVINTGTTIVTFLVVFLIQNTQNRDGAALQLKLDELIRAMEGAHNAVAGPGGAARARPRQMFRKQLPGAGSRGARGSSRRKARHRHTRSRQTVASTLGRGSPGPRVYTGRPRRPIGEAVAPTGGCAWLTTTPTTGG